MNEDNSQLLAQLQDIHAAASPGWWPPAPGWWIVAALVLLVLYFAAKYVLRKVSALRRRRELLAELDKLQQEFDPQENAHEYLAGLNRFFRAVALKAFPGTSCAHLQGDEWVRFIVSLLPEQAETSGLGALARGPYEPLPEFDPGSLVQSARLWVKLYG